MDNNNNHEVRLMLILPQDVGKGRGHQSTIVFTCSGTEGGWTNSDTGGDGVDKFRHRRGDGPIQAQNHGR